MKQRSLGSAGTLNVRPFVAVFVALFVTIAIMLLSAVPRTLARVEHHRAIKGFGGSIKSAFSTSTTAAAADSSAAATSNHAAAHTRTAATTSTTGTINTVTSLSRSRALLLQSLSVRGGGSSGSHRNNSTVASNSNTEYVTLAQPSPGSPFHYAFPVHDLDAAKDFYSKVLGCVEGRSSEKWQDYSLYGHQIVAHWVGNEYRCQDYYNPVDGDEVPVPHAGIALTVDQFHELAERVKQAGVPFIIEPHLRFQGMPGEQYTMFFKDPSGNNLEFKAMTKPENLFAKYNVVD